MPPTDSPSTQNQRISDLYGELTYLTQLDRSLLGEKTRLLPFRAGDCLLEEGDRRQAICTLVSGLLRIERNRSENPQVIAHLTEGEIFGEISFLEGGPASASVVAEDDGEIAIIDGSHVRALLESEPGMAARFYRSIAQLLAIRLRVTSIGAYSVHSWG